MKINDSYELTVSERNVVLSKYVEPVEKFKKVDGIKESQGMTKGSWELQGYYPSCTTSLCEHRNAECACGGRGVTAED